MFTPTSIVNRPIDAAQYYKDSDRMVARISSVIRQHAVTLGRTNDGGIPIYTVPPAGTSASVAPSPVQMVFPQWSPLLASKLMAGVPIPPGAMPEVGNHDANLVIVQLDQAGEPDTLIELFQAAYSDGRWHAKWGGIKQHAQAAQLRYLHIVDDQGHDVELPNWGCSASSLSVYGGVMLQSELKAARDAGEEFQHALQLLLPLTKRGAWAYPAQRCDGNDDDPLAIPEGAHLQLDTSKDYSSLPFPINFMCKAAQQFGVVIFDKIWNGTSFRCQTPASAGFDALAGIPQGVADLFPFEDLHVLPMSLRTHADTTRYRWDAAAGGYVAA